MDHRRRILDHLEKIEAEKPVSKAPRDPQLKMPLIGEVRRLDPAPPKRGRQQRVKKPNQPQLRDV